LTKYCIASFFGNKRMFGSPELTPFGKQRAVGFRGPHLASHSFGQQSATKRKREQVSSNTDTAKSVSSIYVKALKTISLSDESEGNCISSMKAAHLFVNGTLVLLSQEEGLKYLINVKEKVPRSVSLRNCDVVRGCKVIDCGSGPNDSMDLVGSAKDGSIVLANLPSNVAVDGSNVVTIAHMVHLKDKDEEICAICHAGEMRWPCFFNIFLGFTLTQCLCVVFCLSLFCNQGTWCCSARRTMKCT
jgi:hypothetical protein